MNEWKKLPFSNCSILPASSCSFTVPLISNMELVSFCFQPFEAVNTDDTFTRADFHTTDNITKGANNDSKQEDFLLLVV